MVKEGQTQEVTLKGPDTCVLGCILRPYAKGFVRVVDTPYFGVTDAQGRFAIKDVPKGDYQVTLWHEGKVHETRSATIAGKDVLHFEIKSSK